MERVGAIPTAAIGDAIAAYTVGFSCLSSAPLSNRREKVYVTN
jgi:hypothetical protein